MRFSIPALALIGLCLILLAPGLLAQRQPDEATNAQDEQINILVTPPEGDDIGMLNILRTDDFTDQNDYVSQMYPLATQGLELVPHIRLLVEQEGGDVRPWVYIDPETGEQDNWVQVVCPAYQLPFVENIIESMGRPGAVSETGGTRLHYRMHNQLASSVADILERTEIEFAGDGFVEFDNVTNTLFIRDSDSDAVRALAAAQYYDVPARMVDLGVQIIEVDISDIEQLGLDWDAWKTSAAGFIGLTSASRAGLGGEFFSFDTLLIIDATAVAEFLNYLVHVGRASVVTNTNLTVVNGQTATLSSERHLPNLRYTVQNGADPIRFVDETGDVYRPDLSGDADALVIGPGGRAVLNDVSDVVEGYELTFTPTIGTDSMVCMVTVSIASLAGQNDLDEPIVSNYFTESMVGLVDGGTCLLGAFDRRTVLDVQDGIPLLRRIPILGPNLFAETTEQIRHTKLVALLTPRIDENLTYTPDAILNGQRVPTPTYAPYTSPPCEEPPPEFLRAARDVNNAVDEAFEANEAEWR